MTWQRKGIRSSGIDLVAQNILVLTPKVLMKGRLTVMLFFSHKNIEKVLNTGMLFLQKWVLKQTNPMKSISVCGRLYSPHKTLSSRSYNTWTHILINLCITIPCMHTTCIYIYTHGMYSSMLNNKLNVSVSLKQQMPFISTCHSTWL